MEKLFNQEAAYEKWDRKNKIKGKDNYFEEDHVSYLKGLKGRIQNNLSGFLRIALTALIVLLQCLFIIFLPFFLQSLTVYFYFIWEITSVIVIVTMVNRNQSPSYRMAWISIVTLLPISGFIMYYLWGRASGNKRRLDQHILRQISYGSQFLIQDEDVYLEFISEHPVEGRMVKYMETEGFPLSGGNAVDYFSMGEDVFEEIFGDLEKAERFILIDFFIVAEGGIWDKMHEILKRKIEEGVEVKFLYDDFGAAIRTHKFFRQILEHEGFEIRVFNPVHKYTGELYMNYRSHQKILVIDGEVGYTGGFNLRVLEIPQPYQLKSSDRYAPVPDKEIPTDNVKDGIITRWDITITPEDFKAVLGLVKPLYRHATHILSFLPSSEIPHRANADRDAFFDALGDEFTRTQLTEQATAMGIKPNTALSWLRRLVKKGLFVMKEKGTYVRARVCVC